MSLWRGCVPLWLIPPPHPTPLLPDQPTSEFSSSSFPTGPDGRGRVLEVYLDVPIIFKKKNY